MDRRVRSGDTSLGLAVDYGNALSSNVDYDELNFTASYENNVRDLAYSVALTHLEFLADDFSDQEAFFALAWQHSSGLQPYFSYLYSFDARGGFAEIGVQTELLISPSARLSPFVLSAWDFGYITAPHNGRNHLAMGVEFSYQISSDIFINVITERTLAGRDIKRERGTQDLSWMGLTLLFSW